MIKLTRLNTSNNQRIVFLNPTGATSDFWEPLRSLLEAEFEIILCDYPGYADNPYTSYTTVCELSRDLNLKLSSIPIKPTHLIGFSFGSWVCQQLISNFGFNASSLVLIGSSDKIYTQGQNMINNWLNIEKYIGIDYVLAQIGLWTFYTRTFEDVPNLLKNYIERTLTGISTNLAILNQMSAANLYTEGADLNLIRCPTLVLRGHFDHFFPKFCSEKLCNEIANSEMIEVPESGHAAVIENPFFVGKQILKFIYKNGNL